MSSPNSSGSLDGQQSASDLNTRREGNQGGVSQPSENMKRAAAKHLIEQYYYQLTEGCGENQCVNENCASCPSFGFKDVNRNKLALEAIKLSKSKATLCERPNKVSRYPSAEEGASSSASSSTATVSHTTQQISHTIGSTNPPLQRNNLSDGPTCSTSVPSSGEPAVESTGGSFTVTSVQPLTDDEILGPGELIGEGAKSKLPSPVNMSSNSPLPLMLLPSSSYGSSHPLEFLDEEILNLVISECELCGNWSKLNRVIGSVFNNSNSIAQSFKRCDTIPAEMSSPVEKVMEVEEETVASPTRDVDGSSSVDSLASHCAMNISSSVDVVTSPEKSHKSNTACAAATHTQTSHSQIETTTVDLPSLERSFARLMAIPDHPFEGALINALSSLSHSVEMDIKYQNALERNPDFLNVFVIIMELPMLGYPEYMEAAFPSVCRAVGALPLSGQARLARLWAAIHSPTRLNELVAMLQQLITIRIINNETNWGQTFQPGDDTAISSATKVLKILFYASIVGGKLDSQDLLREEEEYNKKESVQDHLQGAFGYEPKDPSPAKEDALAKELEVKVIDCRKPLVPYEDFVNEPLNDTLNIGQDYTNNKFSFMQYSFILTTASKHTSMYYDNRIRMLNERRTAFIQTLVSGGPPNPFLRIRVRRDHLIDDALVNLEMTAMENPSDLRKQLFVEFEGEQGLDEGGVSKEFFQLIVEELFNPDIGMFTYNEQSHVFWFNSSSFENDAQFTLIGIILGLAIYNSCILDIHFPMLVYRKLLGKIATFEDLTDLDPTLHKSLQEMLDYTGDDFEDVFGQTFRIGYQDVFGSSLTFDLKDDGDNIAVNQQNKEEFVHLYADYLLNKAIDRQFLAFKRGFLMVTAESPLRQMFRPEEIEVLVCGSKVFDFQALEQATEYDGGFTEDSSTIKYFWSVVHGMVEEDKRRLLQFTTGTDRVPVGGLSHLKMIIARNGPDSDRLPTSHTCFNVLLLPEYPTVEKMKDRLLKAINYSKGFGML